MTWSLVSLGERQRWTAALEGIRHGVTHTWEHCHALSLTTGLDTYLWVSGTGDDRVVCPLHERTFDEFIDLATPPGIAGFAGPNDCVRLRIAWRSFVQDRHYVAGYIGLHPLFHPPCWQGSAVSYNSIYLLDLQQSAERLLQRLDRNRRRELHGYERLSSGITTDRVRVHRYMADNYSAFADRVSLPEGERWSDATLQSYCDAPATLLLGMEGPDGVVAAHLYAYTPHAADFVLQIASPDGRQHTTLLIWHAMQLLKSMGVPLLNLGGGVQEGDPIARAKQRLGADRHPLTALREVYDRERYDLLCRRTGQDPESEGYFPAYRRLTTPSPS